MFNPELIKVLTSRAIQAALRKLHPRLLTRIISPPGKIALAALFLLLQDATVRRLIFQEAKRIGVKLRNLRARAW